ARRADRARHARAPPPGARARERRGRVARVAGAARAARPAGYVLEPQRGSAPLPEPPPKNIAGAGFRRRSNADRRRVVARRTNSGAISQSTLRPTLARAVDLHPAARVERLEHGVQDLLRADAVLERW